MALPRFLVLNARAHVFHGSLANGVVRVGGLAFSKNIVDVTAVVKVSVV